jgi:hypothetical protein
VGFDFTKWNSENSARTVDAIGNPWAELSRDDPNFQKRVVAVIALKGTKAAQELSAAAGKTISGHDLTPMVGSAAATKKAMGG